MSLERLCDMTVLKQYVDSNLTGIGAKDAFYTEYAKLCQLPVDLVQQFTKLNVVITQQALENIVGVTAYSMDHISTDPIPEL